MILGVEVVEGGLISPCLSPPEGANFRSKLDVATHADGVVRERFNTNCDMITLLCKSEGELNAAIPSANPAKTLQGSEVRPPVCQQPVSQPTCLSFHLSVHPPSTCHYTCMSVHVCVRPLRCLSCTVLPCGPGPPWPSLCRPPGPIAVR